jgi:GTPase SAR1 family protein
MDAKEDVMSLSPISVVGKGGSGKTLLLMKLFNNQKVCFP